MGTMLSACHELVYMRIQFAIRCFYVLIVPVFTAYFFCLFTHVTRGLRASINDYVCRHALLEKKPNQLLLNASVI